jgi:two-component sensor histidine kinase
MQVITPDSESKNKAIVNEEVLQEVHHRIKNNLQIVCSLLRIQGRDLTDQIGQEIFKRMEERIQCMALVYDQMSESEGCDSVTLDQYLENVAMQLISGARKSAARPEIKFDLARIVVSSVVATRLGLLLNEVLSNHLRHRSATLGICLHLKLRSNADSVMFCLSETGSGHTAVISHPSSRDQQILNAMVSQIKGAIEYVGPQQTETRIVFPASELLATR